MLLNLEYDDIMTTHMHTEKNPENSSLSKEAQKFIVPLI